MNQIKTVDEYISQSPEDIQIKLRSLRTIIKEVCPAAEEKLSYSMPYYGYKGRFAYFAYTKNHIGLYIPPPVIENHKDELKDYVTAKATIQFPHQKPLPIDLIKKLLRTRMKINEDDKK